MALRQWRKRVIPWPRDSHESSEFSTDDVSAAYMARRQWGKRGIPWPRDSHESSESSTDESSESSTDESSESSTDESSESSTDDESPSDESAHSWIQGELLGAGAFGKVYKCYHKKHNNVWAVKIVKIEPHYAEDQKEVKAIKNEIDILRNFKHKRIVSYYGSEQKDGHLYLFMEFMAGGSLSDHIKRSNTLSESKSRKYTEQILEGVSFLHSKNIIHRDIKGSNVLLDGHGNVKLADFGLSKIIQKVGSKTNLMSYCGTPYWMAPEIFRGEGYGRKADIWSVGCTVVEMLTGRPPMGHLEPAAAIFKIGSEPTEPATAGAAGECIAICKGVYTGHLDMVSIIM
ncbi:Mitogen-activated protein kinase kinase kinase 2 [Desmophyllum pertusum]|uniref:Mitogen-activated protein kinase kinase kinase 2 n=1 Tax=Desmophyllum pertusum TaxID=174260 RepID=A0A9W9ZVD7_9CNID|nr:Mitogen-activated protein kinase kinase kinase 2 [Desmophyllum pertusum]